MFTFLWALFMLAVTGFLTYLGVIALRHDRRMKREREERNAKNASSASSAQSRSHAQE